MENPNECNICKAPVYDANETICEDCILWDGFLADEDPFDGDLWEKINDGDA